MPDGSYNNIRDTISHHKEPLISQAKSFSESSALQREEVIRVIANLQLQGKAILATTYCIIGL